jgi:hypothetical protein
MTAGVVKPIPAWRDFVRGFKMRNRYQERVSAQFNHTRNSQDSAKVISAADVEYHDVKHSDLLIVEQENKSCTVTDRLGRFGVTEASQRFFASLGRRTGMHRDFFNLFSPAEVVDRLVQVDGDVKFTLAKDKSSAPRLACSIKIRLKSTLWSLMKRIMMRPCRWPPSTKN